MEDPYITLCVNYTTAATMRETALSLAEQHVGDLREHLEDIAAEFTTCIEFAHDYTHDLVTVEVPYSDEIAEALGMVMTRGGAK